jgi:hypothetical protein
MSHIASLTICYFAMITVFFAIVFHDVILGVFELKDYLKRRFHPTFPKKEQS